jgi:tryptophan synthase beta chain
MSDQTKFVLPEDRIPQAWYNLQADLPQPVPPVLHPGTGKPIGPDDLAPLFSLALIQQEVSVEREIEIPGPVREIYYNKLEGVQRLATETGAGQWGSSLAMATCMFGMQCKVFMVRVSYDQKPYRKALMQTYGAEVSASPSTETESGRAILAQDPNTPGSLGITFPFVGAKLRGQGYQSTRFVAGLPNVAGA